MKIVDISMVTRPDPVFGGEIRFEPHEVGAAYYREHYEIDPRDWPTPGCAWANDELEIGTHCGTHMDAPWHFGPRMADGSRPKTIEEWPLERCIGDGVIIDIRDVPDGYEVSTKEVQRRLREINYEIKPGDIVLTMTGNDKYFGTPEYLTRGGGPSRDALKWILEQGVTVVGTDSWSYDRPTSAWAADYHAGGRDPYRLWPCHLLGLEIEYAHIEKLANLDELPPHGFKVVALPIRIQQGTAGPVRAIAIIDG